jgi:hypothetical protein
MFSECLVEEKNKCSVNVLQRKAMPIKWLEKAHIPSFSIEFLKYVMLLEGRRYEIILKK